MESSNIFQITFIIILTFIGCSNNAKISNHFSSDNETIILETEKVKGIGLFSASIGTINFYDTLERYDFPVILPENLKDIKLGWQYVDAKPFHYIHYKNGELERDEFMKIVNGKEIDTLLVPGPKDNSLSILSGYKGNDRVFIVDQNNNKDFRDDSIRKYKPFNAFDTTGLIKCKYNIYNGDTIIEDSTWVNIGISKYNDLLFFVSHHFISTFYLDNIRYQLSVVDNQSNFCFDDPIIAITEDKGIKKDTLYPGELLRLGEFLNLNGNYYEFDYISNDGRQIRLIKNTDLSDKIGTQVGMIAPSFRFRTIDSFEVKFEDFRNEYIIIANTTFCGSADALFKSYKELSDACSDRINLVCLNNTTDSIFKQTIEDYNLKGFFVALSDETAIEGLNSYRPDFSSRECFLINPEGIIVDKFSLLDWKSHLERIPYLTD